MKRAFLVILVLLISTLTITSCADNNSTTTSPTTTPAPTSTPTQGQPVRGGTLKIIHDVNPSGLGFPPTMRLVWDSVLANPALESLTAIDESGNVIPRLAESWEHSSDLKTYTFKLKKGVKFHDGTDFNAQAAKFILDIYRQTLPELAMVSSIDVVDDYTIRLNLSQFDSTIPGSFAQASGWMISPTSYEKNGADWCKINPVGTGPFKFVSWEKDASLKYIKFDDYWQKGKPYLDAIEFIYIADPATASLSLQKGEAHAWVTQQMKEVADLSKIPSFKIVTTPANVVNLIFDSKNENSPFADSRVRKAVAHAIDWEAISDTYGYGYWEGVNQLAFPSAWSYNPNIKGLPYDPAKARELLAEAGYSAGEIKTNLTVLSGGLLQQMFIAVQGYLQDVGIETKLETLQTAAYMPKLTQGWDGLLQGSMHTNLGDETPIMLKRSYSGTNYVSSLVIPEFVDKLDQAIAEPEFAKKQSLVWDAMKIMIEDEALLCAGGKMVVVCVQASEVKDAKIFDPVTKIWTPANAWLSD